jgi:hypothetical protein
MIFKLAPCRPAARACQAECRAEFESESLTVTASSEAAGFKFKSRFLARGHRFRTSSGRAPSLSLGTELTAVLRVSAQHFPGLDLVAGLPGPCRPVAGLATGGGDRYFQVPGRRPPGRMSS